MKRARHVGLLVWPESACLASGDYMLYELLSHEQPWGSAYQGLFSPRQIGAAVQYSRCRVFTTGLGAHPGCVLRHAGR